MNETFNPAAAADASANMAAMLAADASAMTGSVPTAWRTPGGADAYYVAGLAAEDAADARHAATAAKEYLTDGDTPQAASAAIDAHIAATRALSYLEMLRAASPSYMAGHHPLSPRVSA